MFENENKEYSEHLVTINRVAKVVKGGTQFRFAAITVVGDGRGKIGMGYGKAKEVPLAIQKAMQAARKDLHKVSIKDDTIYYEVNGRHGATKVYMQPAADGTGIIAGGAMRAVFECVGIRNILAKSYGSRNPINLVRATINALDSIHSPQRVSKRRGIPVSKIFT